MCVIHVQLIGMRMIRRPVFLYKVTWSGYIMLQGFYDIFWICVNWGHLDNVVRHETFKKKKKKKLPFLLQPLLCKRTLCTFYFNFINLGV